MVICLLVTAGVWVFAVLVVCFVRCLLWCLVWRVVCLLLVILGRLGFRSLGVCLAWDLLDGLMFLIFAGCGLILKVVYGGFCAL